MRRYTQTDDEILSQLSSLDASWQDEHASKIIGFLLGLPNDPELAIVQIEKILETDFRCGEDVTRLFLDMSADDFRAARKTELGEGGIGVTRFKKDRAAFMGALAKMGLGDSLSAVIHRPLHWTDILVERLKAGRGSAVKGQARGLAFETATESVVEAVFGKGGYDVRCRFVRRDGPTNTEKADFAIPTKQDPKILIEAKAYGATGSKQTDVIGDITRIAALKRHDTALIVVTDGVTWNERVSDLRKLVKLQNQGIIARIYTTQMFPELKTDLEDLRRDHHIDPL
jgi:hypothetical protein